MKMENNKSVTAVEWLEKEIECISIQVFDSFLTFIEFMEEREKLCRQAKEMEKKQSDNYAIEFLKWCESKSVFSPSVIHKPTYEKLLQEFKKMNKP